MDRTMPDMMVRVGAYGCDMFELTLELWRASQLAHSYELGTVGPGPCSNRTTVHR